VKPERSYPDTVLVCNWWVLHRPSDRCGEEAPHDMSACGEFDPPRTEPDPVPLGPWPRRSWMNYSTMRPIYWTHDPGKRDH
jgi:hypothetical protein